MGIPHGLVLAVLVTVPLSGQQASQVVSFEDVFAARQEHGATTSVDGRPIECVRRLVTTLLQAEVPPGGRRARPRTVIQAHGELDVMLVSGSKETIDLVAGIHEQLGKPERREWNVQCSVLTLPRKMATAHGILALAVTPVEEAAAGMLIKEAVQAKGMLRNLPEGRIEPLVPFSFGPGVDAEKPEAKPQPGVRVEALMTGDEEAAFAMQLSWPEIASRPLQAQRRECTFRLKAGAGVMMMGPADKYASEDEEVFVLWLRFAGVTTPRPEQQDAASKPRDK